MVEFNAGAAESGTVVIAVDGTLDLAAAPALRDVLHSAFHDGATNLLVDMSAVDFIDTVAIGVLVSGLKTARKNGGDLRISNPGSRVRTILKLAGLDRLFKAGDTDCP